MPAMSTNPWTDPARLAGHYPAHVAALKARHDRALEKAGASHAVIFSGAPKLKFLDDNYYAFQANPHFVSWLPLTSTPHCYLVYTPGETPVLIYYQEKDYWHLPPASPAGYWTDEFDVRIVHRTEDVAAHLPAAREKCVLLGEIADPGHAFGIERVNPTTVLNMLHYARSAKTDYELECMRAASRRGVAGHRAAEAAFRDGRSEFDIHLAYCRAVGQTERQLPYGNIIALNGHAAVLHYQHQSSETPAEFRSFLIDAGATVNGYASDITRTYSYADNEFAELVASVDSMQREIVAEVRAGADFAALHVGTHHRIAKLLAEFGVVRGSPEALLANGVTSAFYPHGLGHLLGLQVHDVAGLMGDENGTIIDRPSGHPYLRLTRRLEENMVLTIEPGIYVIDMLLEELAGTPGHAMVDWERLDWLRPYGGIRVEDNVRVQANGCENLTRDAFAAA